MSRFLSNTGYIKLKITGLNLENFIFDLTSANVLVKNIKRKDKSLFLCISKANYKLFNSLVQKYNLGLEVVAEYGFVQNLKKLPYLIGGLLGIIISVFLVWYTTNFITDVQIVVDKNYVQGVESNSLSGQVGDIEAFLQNLGIKKGNRIQNDFFDVEKQVLANFAQVKNCLIERVGTNIKVVLTEAKTSAENYTKLVAEKNCIITKITTYSGTPLVKAGDTVVAGQTLVEADGKTLPRADIEAKVWHTGTAWHFAKTSKLTKTGNVFVSNAILFNNKVIIPASTCKFEYFESSVKTSFLTTNFLPIKKQTIVYEELKMQEVEESFEEKREEVFAKAKSEATKNMTGSAVECTYSVVTEGDKTKVDCYLLAIEKIGVKM